MNFLKKIFSLAFAFSAINAGLLIAQNNFQNQLVSKTVAYCNDTLKQQFVSNKNLFSEKWDTLAQVKFWQDVIKTSSDSLILNLASERKLLQKISIEEWKDRKSVV